MGVKLKIIAVLLGVITISLVIVSNLHKEPESLDNVDLAQTYTIKNIDNLVERLDEYGLSDSLYTLPIKPDSSHINTQVITEITSKQGYETDSIYLQHDESGKLSNLRFWSVAQIPTLAQETGEQGDNVQVLKDEIYSYTLAETGLPVRYQKIVLQPQQTNYLTEMEYDGNIVRLQEYQETELVGTVELEFSEDPASLVQDIVAVNFIGDMVENGYNLDKFETIKLLRETVTDKTTGEITETVYSYSDDTVEISTNTNGVEISKTIKTSKDSEITEITEKQADNNIISNNKVEVEKRGNQVNTVKIYSGDNETPYLTYEYNYKTLGELYVTSVINIAEQLINESKAE